MEYKIDEDQASSEMFSDNYWKIYPLAITG